MLGIELLIFWPNRYAAYGAAWKHHQAAKPCFDEGMLLEIWLCLNWDWVDSFYLSVVVSRDVGYEFQSSYRHTIHVIMSSWHERTQFKGSWILSADGSCHCKEIIMMLLGKCLWEFNCSALHCGWCDCEPLLPLFLYNCSRILGVENIREAHL